MTVPRLGCSPPKPLQISATETGRRWTIFWKGHDDLTETPNQPPRVSYANPLLAPGQNPEDFLAVQPREALQRL